MFKSCFVARVAVEKSRAVELFCTFDDPQTASTSGNGLPPAQALGGFCFPLGPDNVQPKEYMAPEVSSPHIWPAILNPGSKLASKALLKHDPICCAHSGVFFHLNCW